MSEYCEKCGGDRFIPLSCCSGFQCGCMGQPAQITNCNKCNNNGDKEPSDYIKTLFNYCEYIGVEGGK